MEVIRDMASIEVKIIYTGPVVDDVRNGMQIARYFEPTNSYVDSPVFTDGYANAAAVGDKKTYGKSIYATNVDGWGKACGLLPMASTTTKFAQYERAAMAAAEAEKAGTENTGITFNIEGYEDEIYWNQIAANMADYFYTKVGSNEYGVKPAESDSDDDSNP